MTIEDQLAWFSESDDRVLNAVHVNTRELLAIKTMIQGMAKTGADIVRTMSVLGLMPPPTPDLLSTANFASAVPVAPITALIDIPLKGTELQERAQSLPSGPIATILKAGYRSSAE